MNTSITTRIRELINHTKLSQAKFARRSGITPSSFSRSMSNGFSTQYIRRIADAFNVNIDWLNKGVGSMFASIDKDEEAHKAEILKQFEELQSMRYTSQNDELKDGVEDTQEISLLRQKVAMLERMVKDKSEEIDFLRSLLNSKKEEVVP